jgi:hypothetical protein
VKVPAGGGLSRRVTFDDRSADRHVYVTVARRRDATSTPAFRPAASTSPILTGRGAHRYASNCRTGDLWSSSIMIHCAMADDSTPKRLMIPNSVPLVSGIFDWLTTNGMITMELTRLIGHNVITGEPHPYALRVVNAVHDLRNRGLHRESATALMLARRLVADLREIEAHDPQLLEYLRQKLLSMREDDYVSFRFEASMAACLVRSKVGFQWPDHPDFLVEYQGHDLPIECTTARVTRPPKSGLEYKALSALRAKQKKGYATPASALCIDCSNLYFHSVRLWDRPLDIDDLTAKIQQALVAGGFGSVLIFFYVAEELDGHIGVKQIFFRVDGHSIAPELRAFLDMHLSTGAGDPSSWWGIPAAG